MPTMELSIRWPQRKLVSRISSTAIARFASPTLVLETHGQQKGYIPNSAMAKHGEGSCIKLYSE